MCGHLLVPPRDTKLKHSHQCTEFLADVTKYLVFAIDTNNDPAKTDTPTQNLLLMQTSCWPWWLR